MQPLVNVFVCGYVCTPDSVCVCLLVHLCVFVCVCVSPSCCDSVSGSQGLNQCKIAPHCSSVGSLGTYRLFALPPSSSSETSFLPHSFSGGEGAESEARSFTWLCHDITLSTHLELLYWLTVCVCVCVCIKMYNVCVLDVP